MSTTTKARPKKNAAKVVELADHGRIEYPAVDLKRIIRSVAPMAATDFGSTPLLCAVSVELRENDTRWVATDSYRLNCVTTNSPSGPPSRALIPAAWLLRWARIKTDKDATAVLSWAGERVAIECGGDEQSTNLIPNRSPTGRGYPSFDTYLADDTGPTDVATAMNPRYLKGTLDTCAIFGGTHPVRVLKLDPMKACMFAVVDPDLGELRAIIMPVRVYP